MPVFSHFRICQAVALVGVAALPTVADAQANTSGADTRFDARARSAVVDSTAAFLERAYVSRDTARLIATVMRDHVRSGAYDKAESPARFAELVTADMRSINQDLHLSLRFDAANAERMRRPGAHGVEGGPGAAPDGPDREPTPPSEEEARNDPFLRNARRQNYGFGRVDILPGNVGYLEITGFIGAPGYEEPLANALRYLGRTDALIIDVRRNGGGSGEMSHRVFSHFLPETPVPTIRVVNVAAADTVAMKSFARVPGPRRTEVPLYVLTSRGTASAAEEFTFVLKNLGRATIVGDRTAGAGHMVAAFNAGHGFVASVSFTRVTDARSAKEWERVGVQPDVQVNPELALEAAHAAALRRIASRAQDEGVRKSLIRIAEGGEAQVSRPKVDPARLATLAGSYEGGREVRLVNGALQYVPRPGVLPEPMIPLGGDSFALLRDARLLFAGTGSAVTLTTETADGTRLTYARLK